MNTQATPGVVTAAVLPVSPQKWFGAPALHPKPGSDCPALAAWAYPPWSPCSGRLAGQGAQFLPAARGAFLSVEILPFHGARNLIMLLIKARCRAWEIYFLFHICGRKCHSGSSKAHVSLNQALEQTFCSQFGLLSPSSSVPGRKCVLWYPALTPSSLAPSARGREGEILGQCGMGREFSKKFVLSFCLIIVGLAHFYF